MIKKWKGVQRRLPTCSIALFMAVGVSVLSESVTASQPTTCRLYCDKHGLSSWILHCGVCPYLRCGCSKLFRGTAYQCGLFWIRSVEPESYIRSARTLDRPLLSPPPEPARHNPKRPPEPDPLLSTSAPTNRAACNSHLLTPRPWTPESIHGDYTPHART